MHEINWLEKNTNTISRLKNEEALVLRHVGSPKGSSNPKLHTLSIMGSQVTGGLEIPEPV